MTTISALPTAPSRADPSTFSDRSDALLGALDTFVSETNTVAGEVNTNAATATTQAALATTNGAAQVSLAAAQVALATTQATNAANSAISAATSALTAGAIAWVSGTTYSTGNVRYSPIDFQAYRRKTDGAGTTDPSLDSANWAKALLSGVSAVTTATTATTLTSTATLLKITPASYGVAVTLPDATTCDLGGPLHIIDNKGAYPVRVLNSAGTLLGFVYGGVVSHVSLADKSTAAGVWAVENSELVGASAQLLTTNIIKIANNPSVIDLGSSRELLIGQNAATTAYYAVVYDRSTNTFGSQTLVRTVAPANTRNASCLVSTDKVLFVSCDATTAFEAVVLTISGTTITVNTAATATLATNIATIVDACGLIAVGSSFVCSYTLASGTANIRALSVSGTTVTIGSQTVLDGTSSGLITASANHVIAVSTATTHLYTKPYLVSGSTLTAGTGTDTNSGTMTLNHLAALGTRWYVGYNDGGTTVKGGVISLNTSGNGTTTISAATLFSAGTVLDAIIIGSTKVLAINDATTNNANILTDSSGTASAGTAITLDSETARACIYADGTNAVVGSGAGGANIYTTLVDCSGSSPVKTKAYRMASTGNVAVFSASNNALIKATTSLTGTAFAHRLLTMVAVATATAQWRVKGGEAFNVPVTNPIFGGTAYRGKSDSERWVSDLATLITKFECVA